MAEFQSIKDAFNSISEGICITDPSRSDNPIIKINDAFEEMTGYTESEVIGKNCRFLQGPDTSQKTVNKLGEAIDNRKSITTEILNYKKSGTSFWNRLTIDPVYKDDCLVRFVGIQRNITDSKLEIEKLRNIMNSSSHGILLVDFSGKIQESNSRAAEIFGYSIDEMVSQKIEEFIPERFRSKNFQFREEYLSSLESRPLESNQELLGLNKNGDEIPVEIGLKPVKTPQNKFILADIVDITERREAESELKESRDLIEATEKMAHIGGWSYDIRKKELSWTDETYRIHGLSPDDEIELSEATEFYHPDDRQKIKQSFENCLENGTHYDEELQIITADDEERWVQTMGKPSSEDRENEKISGTIQDITESKETREELEESLETQKILLQEVHHRVKNNLQLVISLLKLQLRELNEVPDDFRSIITDIVNRIKSMGLIHEQVYQVESIGRLQIRDYLTRLADQIITSKTMDDTDIKLKTDIEPLEINLDTIVPCGLITNELLSNAIDHGFKTRSEGQITLSFKQKSNDEFVYVVKDSGVGWNNEHGLEDSDSLGLRLVKNLVQNQLKGSIEPVEMENGVELQMIFQEIEK